MLFLLKLNIILCCLGGIVLLKHSVPLGISFFLCFFLVLRRYYASEERVYERGVFSLLVSFLIIVSEIIMRFSGICDIVHIVILDCVNGYVFLTARRILIPLTSEIIERFKGEDGKRFAFGVLMLMFGIVFVGLQGFTLYQLFAGEDRLNWFTALFFSMQLLSAYWGVKIANLGNAICQGDEPDFATAKRLELEELKERLAERRETVLFLSGHTSSSGRNVRESAFQQFSGENKTVILPRSQTRAFRCFIGGLVSFVAACYFLTWGAFPGSIILFVIAFLLIRDGIRGGARKGDQIEFSRAGIRVKYKQSDQYYLWVEFLLVKIKGARKFLDPSEIALKGYDPNRHLTFKVHAISTRKVARAIEKYIDEPAVMSPEMDLIDLNKYLIKNAESYDNTPQGIDLGL